MKVLFLQEEIEVSPNAKGGASSLVYCHLMQLLKSGHEVNVVILSECNDSTNLERSIGSLQKLQNDGYKFSVDYICLNKGVTIKSRTFFLLHPEMLIFPQLTQSNIGLLRKKIVDQGTKVIWAEHFFPALMALHTNTVPVIYSQHDWVWKLLKLKWQSKNVTYKKKLRNYLLRFIELNAVKQASYVISGSISDVKHLKSIGLRNVEYLPPVYDHSIGVDPYNIEIEPRIVHLGGMSATANRLGLERFMDVVWPKLVQIMINKPKLLIIGDMTHASSKLLESLNMADAHCTGFIPDLSYVLRPGDIHIIPWEYDTGTRTRLPLAFAYGQALVATKQSVACFGETKNQQNCILVDNLTKMADEINSLFFDSVLRCQICKNARATFLSKFTYRAQQEQIINIIDHYSS